MEAPGVLSYHYPLYLCRFYACCLEFFNSHREYGQACHSSTDHFAAVPAHCPFFTGSMRIYLKPQPKQTNTTRAGRGWLSVDSSLSSGRAAGSSTKWWGFARSLPVWNFKQARNCAPADINRESEFMWSKWGSGGIRGDNHGPTLDT